MRFEVEQQQKFGRCNHLQDNNSDTPLYKMIYLNVQNNISKQSLDLKNICLKTNRSQVTVTKW